MIHDLESIDAKAFLECLHSEQTAEGKRNLKLDGHNAATGLGRLAVAIVNLLHELLERQAIRRMERGTLTEAQIEDVGNCLMKQSEAIDQLCEMFDVTREELNLDLGPLGRLI